MPNLTDEEIDAFLRRRQPAGPDSDEDWVRWSRRACRWAYALSLSRIPSSRILKDGEREELEILRKVAKIIDDKRNAQWERRGAGPCQRMPDEIDNLLCDWYEIQANREYDALRFGEAEGRMG